VASAGLFLATTAVAQFAQALASKWKEVPPNDGCHDEVPPQEINGNEEDCVDMEELRRWYHSRRVHDRLSYENLQDCWITGGPPPAPLGNTTLQHPISSLTLDENDMTLRRGNKHSLSHKKNGLINQPGLMKAEPRGLSLSQLSEWDVHHQTSKQRQQSASSFKSLERHDSLTNATEPMHPNADYDFHPKNRNWRHFEHFNENDPRRKAIPTTPSTPQLGSSLDLSHKDENATIDTTHSAQTPSVATAGTRMMDTDDEEDDEQQDANSLSSEGSESSEEQFVWMKHLHRHRSSSSSQPEEQQSRMTAFLNLFNKEDSASNPKHSTSESKEIPTASKIQRDSSNQSAGPASKSYTRQKSLPISPSLSLASTSVADPNRQMKRQSSMPLMAMGPYPHRELRAQYNATIMPKKLILIRHGQSMGNINELLYSTTPDNAMPLTQLGWEQARAAGNILKNKILTSGETVHFIVSPYVRTVETFHGMVSAWVDPKEFSHIANKEKRIKAWYRKLMEMGLTWNEDSRIREQDFGNYQDPETIRKAKQERHRFGVFYYRFPHGESASDVFDRVSTFLDSLWRNFEMNKSQNYVLVTHGISIRVLLARYFRYTIDQFNILANPRNCEMVVLGHNGQGRLDLQGRVSLELGTAVEEGNEDVKEGEEKATKVAGGRVQVKGYKFHKRLRILPKHAIRKVKIRISPDD